MIFLYISEGPYVRLANSNDDDGFEDLVRDIILYLIYINYLFERFGIGLIHLKLKMIVIIEDKFKLKNICLLLSQELEKLSSTVDP